MIKNMFIIVHTCIVHASTACSRLQERSKNALVVLCVRGGDYCHHGYVANTIRTTEAAAAVLKVSKKKNHSPQLACDGEFGHGRLC